MSEFRYYTRLDPRDVSADVREAAHAAYRLAVDDLGLDPAPTIIWCSDVAVSYPGRDQKHLYVLAPEDSRGAYSWNQERDSVIVRPASHTTANDVASTTAHELKHLYFERKGSPLTASTEERDAEEYGEDVARRVAAGEQGPSMVVLEWEPPTFQLDRFEAALEAVRRSPEYLASQRRAEPGSRPARAAAHPALNDPRLDGLLERLAAALEAEVRTGADLAAADRRRRRAALGG